MALRRSIGPAHDSPRTAVVWDVLDAALVGGPHTVVDIGGGTGGSAVRLAAAGHRVTVVDPSPDALAALGRRAGEAGVDVDGRQGDVAGLVDLVGEETADVVLCHGVLEVVDAEAALAAIRRVLRPEGTLSLLVAQRHAAVLARAMAGQFQQAIAMLEGGAATDGRRGRRYGAEEVRGLVAASGFAVRQTHGIRVFADHVPSSLLDLEPGATASLIELERAAAARADYHAMATQLHLLCARV